MADQGDQGNMKEGGILGSIELILFIIFEFSFEFSFLTIFSLWVNKSLWMVKSWFGEITTQVL